MKIKTSSISREPNLPIETTFHIKRFKNLQRAWEGINEFLFLDCDEIEKNQGSYYGTEWISFNNYIIIDKAIVNPNFDFGKKLGYSKAKWSALVKNYVNIHYIDIVKNTINHREGKKAKSYNHTIHFTNKHGSGKDCLISLTLTKRPNIKKPIAVFHIRTSEVTKRLLFDFLLVQRVIEFIYGHNDIEVHFFAPSFYITAESFVMYNNIKPIQELLWSEGIDLDPDAGGKEIHYFQQKVLDTIRKYMDHPDPQKVMFRVTRRSMLQIRKDKKGEPESGVGSMFARDLKLIEPRELYPKNVITKREIKKYKTL